MAFAIQDANFAGFFLYIFFIAFLLTLFPCITFYLARKKSKELQESAAIAGAVYTFFAIIILANAKIGFFLSAMSTIISAILVFGICTVISYSPKSQPI